jgi:poly-gamma-glutamate capsule biosynthesis protein CapA/YwtB (metallophosphatase superfamily)
MYKGSLALAGEFLGTRPFSMRDEPEFLELIRILREADTTYCHMEMNIHGKDSYPVASALQADPIIAHEVKWAGIDLVSCAYNHSQGWGSSILGTIESLDRAGVVNAGTGNNLEEAREPAYFESRAGRVAVISISSGHHSYDSALPSKPPVRGRPGVNPLRITQKYVVPPESVERLTELWKMLGLSQRRPSHLPLEEGEICLSTGDFGGSGGTLIFKPGDQPRVISIPDQWDLEGNIRAIKDARRQADLVLVAHHAAVNEGTRGEKPCKFVEPFAKQCIDAGADVFVGHGWHKQLGFEIYKGKPIWYGTGNFFAQSQFLTRFPADNYEHFGFSLDELTKVTPADLHDIREKRMSHWSEEPGGVIAVLGVEGGQFNEMKLYPYTLGYDYGEGDKSGKVRETGIRMEGRPMLADRENGEKIIAHVKRLSGAFGTNIEYKAGIGVVALE